MTFRPVGGCLQIAGLAAHGVLRKAVSQTVLGNIHIAGETKLVKDTDYSDDCYVRWVPAWTGRYTIRIVNRGPVYNRFVILTN